MAQPSTVRPSKMRILIGDGGSPEAFFAPCGLTSKSITTNKNLSDQSIPDCSDPDAAFWLARDVESLSMEISGEGLLTAEYESVWTDANYSVEPSNVRIEVEFDIGTRIFSGAFHITTSINGQQGRRVSINVSMQSDGIITPSWLDA